MDMHSILNQLKHQRDSISAALAALEGTKTGNGRRHSRYKSNAIKPKRTLNAAARKRISEAAKARWAKAKKAGRNRL